MNNLTKRISDKTGISHEKASEVLFTVSEFIKEKYPLMAGVVDSVLEREKVKDLKGNNNIG